MGVASVAPAYQLLRFPPANGALPSTNPGYSRWRCNQLTPPPYRVEPAKKPQLSGAVRATEPM